MVRQVERIAQEIVNRTAEYQNTQDKKARKEKGQFFSSLRVAEFMAASVTVPACDEISVLDPGAGSGLLGFLVLSRLLSFPQIKKIHLTYVENDAEILPILTWVKQEIESLNESSNAKISVQIIEKNFILDVPNAPEYDIVISNPPYAKISKQAPEAKAMEKYVYGQPNIYALFVVKSLQMLKANASFSFITPRSWTSGNYFIKMREFIAHNVNLRSVHLFNARDTVFSSEDVLQETMIWSGEKIKQQEKLNISISEDDKFSDTNSFSASYQSLVSDEKYRCLILPSSSQDYLLLKAMKAMDNTLAGLGYSFKTGPVVEFRNREAIFERREANAIPMIRPSNIKDGGFSFPVNIGKAQYVITEKEPSFALPNSPTVIVKRMSSKEEPRRLQCCVYYPMPGEAFISMENHVNYLVRDDGKPLGKEEVEWVYSLLSSEQYDRYVRMLSGSTQINARDLNMLPAARRGT